VRICRHMEMVVRRRQDMLRRNKRLCCEVAGSMELFGAYRFPFGLLI
jgi:hypothetical protein